MSSIAPRPPDEAPDSGFGPLGQALLEAMAGAGGRLTMREAGGSLSAESGGRSASTSGQHR
jgi:hypothetical protein